MENKIFIVSHRSMIGGVIDDEQLIAFDNEKSALRKFQEIVANEIPYVSEHNWVVDNESNSKYYCAYEQGNFPNEHIIIQVEETPVISNIIKIGEYYYDKDELKEWEDASKTAIMLWETPCECVKVEITSEYVKFYRRDDMLSIYTYPPLSKLKKDKKFIKSIEEAIEETYIGNERELHWELLHNWESLQCDYPPFPISMIFHSEYQNYNYKSFN